MRGVRIKQGDDEVAVLELEPASASAIRTLTRAEREIVALVLDALSSEEIARIRKRSTRTVANQLASIYRKLRVRSRAELVLALVASEDAPTNSS